jgi:hypothetical protein
MVVSSTPRSNFTDVRSPDTTVTNLDISNDDHFTTALAAIGTFPELVTSLMQVNTNNNAGVFVV